MPRVHTVKKAAKDYPDSDIKKGDTYYWWKFRYGGMRRSKEHPKPWQLTQSEFLSGLMQAQDALSKISGEDVDDLKQQVEDVAAQLQELADGCQERFDNMPEGLQQGDTGQLLEARVEAMESAIGDLEGIDFDDIPDKEDLIEEVRTEIYEEIDEENELVNDDPATVEKALDAIGKFNNMTPEQRKEAIDKAVAERKAVNEKVVAEHEEEIGQRVNDKIQEALQEKIEEIQNISIDAE